MAMTLEQENIIHSPAKDLLVPAFAGTGKSFTAIEYIKARPNDKILYLVFNASASKEMQERLFKKGIRNVTVKTLHSLAYSQMKDIYKTRLENTNYNIVKMAEIYGKYFPSQKDSRAKIRAMRILNEIFIGFLKSVHTKPDEILKKIPLDCIIKMKNYNISIGELQDAMKKLWANSLSPSCTEPVSHDVYLKVYQLILREYNQKGNLNALGYSCIILDEAQDTFPSALEIVRSQESANHLILGDPYQQIYGWNKSIDAFGVLKKEKKSNGEAMYEDLPLTQSFRCPQEITERAMPWLALLGNEREYKGLQETLPDDKINAYLTRTNSVLLLTMAKMQEEGILEKNYSNACLFGGANKYDFTELSDCALMQCNQKSQIKNDLFKAFNNFGDIKEFAVDTEDEKLSTTCSLVERFSGKFILSLIGQVKRGDFLPSPEPGCYVFSTAHKIKGSEAANVHLTEDFISPLKIIEKARKAEETQKNGKQNQDCIAKIDSEELRLMYVAGTRAKNTLTASMYDILPPVLVLIKEDIEKGYLLLQDEDPSGKKISINDLFLKAIKSEVNKKLIETNNFQDNLSTKQKPKDFRL